MKENLLAQRHGLGWSPSSESRTDVHGTLFLWEEFSGRMEKRDGRGLRETREEIEAQVPVPSVLEPVDTYGNYGGGQEAASCVIAWQFLVVYVYLPVGASVQRKGRRRGVRWGDGQRRGIEREEELKEGADVSYVCT